MNENIFFKSVKRRETIKRSTQRLEAKSAGSKPSTNSQKQNELFKAKPFKAQQVNMIIK